MTSRIWFYLLNYSQALLGAAVLVLLVRARELKNYWPLLPMALWETAPFFMLLFVRAEGDKRISPHMMYMLYFYTSWTAFGIGAIASLLFSYVLFGHAMRPLKGLRSLGNIVFSWVAFISILTSLAVAMTPALPGLDRTVLALTQFERTIDLITISLVAFVAFAIRPMGLSRKSRVFGASIGTFLVAVANVVDATFGQQTDTLYHPFAIAQLACSCIAQVIWIYYFAKEEPQRNFISLPTTSPFHYWNDIALRLGQDPGVVAIGGFNPNAFAGAEVEVFRRASAKMSSEDPGSQQHSGDS